MAIMQYSIDYALIQTQSNATIDRQQEDILSKQLTDAQKEAIRRIAKELHATTIACLSGLEYIHNRCCEEDIEHLHTVRHEPHNPTK